MPELIDRIELRKDFCNMCEAMQPEMIDCEKKGCMSMQIIDDQPTIEPKVQHGRWKGWTTSKFTGKYKDYDEPEFKDYVYYTCSECYRKSAIQELYCPNCGARMDGGADNANN